MYASKLLMKLKSNKKRELKDITIRDLLMMTQQELFKYLLDNIPGIQRVGKTLLVKTKGGNTFKPLLCAHLDTVANFPPSIGDILEWNDTLHLHPQSGMKCLGADDRAGVYILIQLLLSKERNKYNYGFFKDEEVGCVGSRAFTLTPEYDDLMVETSCFIGVDRQCEPGAPEYATYDCDDKELSEFLDEALPDFAAEFGSLSDCSTLSEACLIPCFNMTAGYMSEHTKNETLHLPTMIHTIESLKTLDIPDKQYEYEEVFSGYNSRYNYGYGYSSGGGTSIGGATPICCDQCGEHALLYEDYTMGEYFCENCLCIDIKEDA